ncbi:MAG: hypothetical protein Q9184_007842 [Pyrenodesmia sp. 2 TL-2023]
MAPQPSEADIIFNRANVALAKSQRLVASWLPPRTEEEAKTAKTEEEIEKEEQELFTPVPELLGLGAKVPDDLKDGDMKRQKLTSNDLLRRQLLGKDHAKARSQGGHRHADQKAPGATLPVGSKPRPAALKRKADDSSEDEGGRSSLGKRKHLKYISTGKSGGEGSELVAEAMDHKDKRRERPEVIKSSRRSTNYLDEVLSQKNEKKHKSKKKKKGPQDMVTASDQ